MIEDLKKYNTRRKLKAVILSAVNSSKWYPYDETNEDALSDFGDDEVSACGKSTRFHTTVRLLCLFFNIDMITLNSINIRNVSSIGVTLI